MPENKTFVFTATLNKIGINPFVFLPEEILVQLCTLAKKEKGKIPLKVRVNNQNEYSQTLLRYKGEWRLYINTIMLKNAPKKIGEQIQISLVLDSEEKIWVPHPKIGKGAGKQYRSQKQIRWFAALP